MDAANMLKPALARGEFRMLGATTDEEYERWILGDPALERRFQKIAVRELSPAETLEILRTRMPSLARHHNVVITDAAIRAAIELTDLWVPDRRRPDKAIDALDEACAHTAGHRAVLAASARSRSSLGAAPWDGRRSREAAERRRAARGAQTSIASRATASPSLERLGAEIEAAFAGPRRSRASRGTAAAHSRRHRPPPARARRPAPIAPRSTSSSSASCSTKASSCADTTSRASSAS